MATQSQAESRGMYSWWWDSHISPKNSKWLHENLTDMDANVKAMIKVIEEDADTFAERAEMYYKKRPELMKLLESFYRAYRALAERYDHATGVLQQAHQTMAEAFPNQVPLVLTDDSPFNFASDTPEISIPIRAMFDNGNSALSRKCLKRLNDLFGSEDHGKFSEGNSKTEYSVQSNEKEILILKERLSSLERESEKLNERASKAESEAWLLKQDLAKVESEKHTVLDQYKQSLEIIPNLEKKLLLAEEGARKINERSEKAESENENLKQVLDKLTEEKGIAFKSMGMQLMNQARIFKEMEDRFESFRDQILKVKEENKNLNELNLSSSMSIKDMKDEIFSLRETNEKLAHEVELRADQRNALQQEIYCLEEKLKESNKKQRSENVAFEELLDKNALLESSVSHLSDELEGTTGKTKALEESCQSLLEEISVLAAEKANLMTQLHEAIENFEKLSEKNNFLESSLFDAHDELEVLREKSKSLKDSCQLLDNEKSGLIKQKDSLYSHLTITQQKLEELEKRYEEFEEKISCSEREKRSMLCEVEELRIYLEAEKIEHALFTELSEKRLEAMEIQIRDLEEKGRLENRNFEEELNKAVDSKIEIFNLQKCVEDLQEKNKSLSSECQKLLKASKFSEKLVSELEHENFEHRVEVKYLSDQNHNFRRGIYQFLRVLDIDLDHGVEDKDGQEHTYLNHILEKLEDSITFVCKAEDENQKLAVQMSVIVTIFGQLRLEAENLKSEKDVLDHEFSMKTEKFSLLQMEADKLLGLNEELRSNVRVADHQVEILRIQMENLRGKLLDLQEQNSKLLEEKRSSMKEISEVEEKLHTLKGAVKEKMTIIGGKIQEVEMENLHLKEKLKKSGDELKRVECVCDQLGYEIANGKDLLLQKEMEISEVEKKFIITENEKSELREIVEDLKRECGELEAERKKQEKRSIELSEENEDRKIREENLCSELQKGKHEIDQWRTEAGVFFRELQFSNVCLALFEEKIRELTEAYERLEDQNGYKDMYIELLKQNVSNLEAENVELKAQFDAYVPTITSLRESISSLENHLCMGQKIQKIGYEETKDAELAISPRVESCSTECPNVMAPNAVSNLWDLQIEVKVMEQSVNEMDRVALQEKFNVNTKLEAETREIEELKSKSGSEISEKEIMLDHISKSPSHEICRRDHVENDNQILELWETTDQNGSIDLTVGKAKRDSKCNPTSEVLVEKDLAVDNSEISERSVKARKENHKRKVLERLDSDAQKLTNLRITVQDLKRKVDITEKTKKGKSIVEFDSVKNQLEEVEEAIQKLFDHNGRLTKNMEKISIHSDGKSGMESEESISFRRKRISDQARRVSEKIGRLQLEIQKIQFFLVKLDDEKEKKGKTRVEEKKRRILLRDYLYGGVVRTSHRRKKTHCCGCVQTPTKGD